MYTFPLLEAISLKSRGLQGHALSKGSRVDSVPHLFPVSGGYWHSLVYGLWLHHSNLCLHLHITFSCSTLCISYKDTWWDLGSTQIIWNELNSRSLLSLQMVPSSKKGNVYRYQELDMNIFLEEETIFFSLPQPAFNFSLHRRIFFSLTVSSIWSDNRARLKGGFHESLPLICPCFVKTPAFPNLLSPRRSISLRSVVTNYVRYKEIHTWKCLIVFVTKIIVQSIKSENMHAYTQREQNLINHNYTYCTTC